MTEPRRRPTRENAYAAAGVSIEAADKAIELMKVWVDKARRPEMIGGLGGFAGLFDASVLKRYDRPLLATSTDGVGTKVAIAQAMDVHDTIGFDLVGMVVDDLVVCGAEPLFMTDYIATGRVVPERIAAIVKGIAEACVEAGCALVGGETAEHPGLLEPRRVRRRRRDHRRGRGRPAARPRPGPPRRRGDRDGGQRPALQRLLPGPPRAARDTAGWALDRDVAELGRTLGRGAARRRPGSTPRPASTWPTGPTPTRCPTSPAAGSPPTSSGCCRSRSSVTIDRSTWTPQPIFDLVRRVGDVPQPDLEATLNCGVGMVALTPPDDADTAIEVLAAHGVRAWVGRRGPGRRTPERRRPGRADRSAPRLVSRVRGRISVPASEHFGVGVREHPASR